MMDVLCLLHVVYYNIYMDDYMVPYHELYVQLRGGFFSFRGCDIFIAKRMQFNNIRKVVHVISTG